MRGAAGALLLLATASAAEAGPWAVGRGHFYVKVGVSRLRSTTLAAPDGTRFDIPRFIKDEVGVYGIYGLTGRLSAYATAPLLRSSDLADDPDELQRESGFGDLQVGLQAELGRRGAWVFGARGLVQAPTGDVSRAEGLLPTGSGAWEGEAALSAGRSIAGGKGYGFLEVGHQVRGEGLRDSFIYNGQIGWNVTDRLVLAANVRGVEPYDKTPPREARGSFAGVGDRVTYVSYGPTAIVKLRRGWSVQLDLDGASRARNLADGLVFRAGVSLSR